MKIHEKLVRRIMANVILIRKDKNMSQRQLAAGAGISESYYSLLESGQRHPSMETICNIAHALNVEPSTLMTPEKES